MGGVPTVLLSTAGAEPCGDLQFSQLNFTHATALQICLGASNFTILFSAAHSFLLLFLGHVSLSLVS